MLILQPLQIKSVVAKEGLKGYIYIEAYKQTHVKHAIEGIGNLRIGYYQQQVSVKLRFLLADTSRKINRIRIIGLQIVRCFH